MSPDACFAPRLHFLEKLNMLHHQNEPALLPKPHEFELDDFLLDDLFLGEPKNASCTVVVLFDDDFLFLAFLVFVFFHGGRGRTERGAGQAQVF